MKYVNAKNILPQKLVDEIMEYVDGVYIYIPKKDSNIKSRERSNDYKIEMKIRDVNIYEHYLIGMSYEDIADMYCLSEKSIRRIVLSQKKRLEPEKMKVEKIINEFGVTGNIKQIYTSAWEIDNKYVLKKYTDVSELQRNVNVLSVLYAENVPVPKIINTNDGKMYYDNEGEYWVLTEKLQGSNIVNVNKCDEQWFFNMGRIIAKLHIAFDACENKIQYWNNSLLGEMESWIKKNIEETNDEYISIDELDSVIYELKKVDDKLSRGLIHRDVHLGNFLFYNNKFSGYIDFDLSQKNIRVFDICYFMLGLLLEEEENKVDENKWFEYLTYVVKGYNSLIKMSDDEYKSIAVVMESIELLFVAYFIGEHDDKAARDSLQLYRFCKDNHDRIIKCVSNISFLK